MKEVDQVFNQYNQLSEVREVIAKEQLVFLYIGQENCSVCHGLKPQIEKIIANYPEIATVELDAIKTPAVAEAFQVLAVPVLLLFVEGKEYLRKARIVNTSEFSQQLEKIVLGVRSMNQE